MPIDTSSYIEIAQRVIADIANALPDVDPTITGSFVNALAISNAGRHYDNVLLIEQLIIQLYPQTATGEYLERWAQYEGLSRLAATPSQGFITVTGTALTSIPASTEWRTSDNILIYSLNSETLAATTYTISTLTRSGTTATATTSTDHTIATGMQVVISGATETDYNGTFEVLVTATDEFTYEVSGSPSTPATGSPQVDYTGASIEVEAVEPGIDGNLLTGAQLQVTSPIVGLDSDAFVQYDGLSGGTDEETDESLRARVLYSRANPVANFNESDIVLKAQEVNGVTRVFVNRITPYVGAVTVAFMRDNDVDPIPDSTEVAAVRASLLEILPAQTDPNDLIVQAPTPVSVDFTFTNITPDSLTMRTAIENSLTVYFDDEAEYETDIDEDKYKAVIINTIDIETGLSLQSFTLSAPSGDVTITTGEIGILGTVSFP